ncbi:MAG: S-layer homology domain-containing protein [Candidatus Gracilibacteria bacterium]|jgi:hypothetical protein
MKKQHFTFPLLSLAFFGAFVLAIPLPFVTLFAVDTNTPNSIFSDLSSNNPFFDAVNYVQSQGIVSGYENGTYRPDNQINRAEFVKIIIGANFTKEQISGCTPTKTFPDIHNSDWFYQYVCVASNNGIVNGYPDGSFKPGNYINFPESSKIIVNAFGYQTSQKEIWYQSFVEKLEELKAIPVSICSVTKNISRGEMAEMIYRLKKGITTKSSTNFFTGNPQTLQTTTFVKSYRLKDTADTYAITQTLDGEYAITGHTVNHNEMKGPSMFFIKADSNGNKKWSKLFDNGGSEGYAITQLTDGNIVAAGEVSNEFITDAEQETLEGQGDNFIVKLDGNGNNIWTRTVGQKSTDIATKLFPTKDGGFVMSGSTGVLVGQPDVADINDTVLLGNFDANGQTNWLKKIEGDEKMTKSVKQTADGGYILIGNVKLVEENDQKVPALVKLKPNGEFEWATGLENLPIEIPNLIMNPDGKSFTVGTPNKMHLAFGQFLTADQTNDGGYIALGSYFSAISTAELAKLQTEAFKEWSLVAVKTDSTGKLQWARTIKVKRFLEDVVIKKTSDDGYIIMGNNLVGGYVNKDTMAQSKIYDQMMADYYAKYPIMSPETPESKKALDAISKEIESWQSGLMVKNIVLIKLDKNFNYQWGKNIGGTKDLDGYDITQTADSGYAITGTWHTGIKHRVLTSILEYTEAMIMKLDVNGNLGNSDLVADFSDTEASDVSSYIVTNKLTSPELVVEYPMDNIARTIKLSNKTGVSTTASEATTYQTQICVATNTNGFTGGTGTGTGTGGATPTTKTRPQMKYDETNAITATSPKGIIINDELMPVLKGIFNDVKLWDDFAGGWVAYRFSRLVTKDDIGKIVTALEGRGYKIDSNVNGDFTATKIGLTLNFHFKLGDTNTGQVDVMY